MACVPTVANYSSARLEVQGIPIRRMARLTHSMETPFKEGTLDTPSHRSYSVGRRCSLRRSRQTCSTGMNVLIDLLYESRTTTALHGTPKCTDASEKRPPSGTTVDLATPTSSRMAVTAYLSVIVRALRGCAAQAKLTAQPATCHH